MAWLALIAVWFFWGTTYLGIRMALESVGPIHLICIRFFLSGLILLLGARIAGAHIPTGRELWYTAATGLMLLGGGTGSLVFAEQWIPSGTAALIVVLSAFWTVGVEALTGGEKLHRPTLAGMLLGFAGIVVLVWPDIAGGLLNKGLVGGFLLLQFGAFSWAMGSVLQRRQPTVAHPIVSGAIQQLAVGVAFLPLAILIPEHPVVWSTRGTLALTWLVVFGSIVGYSAFIYTLEHMPIALVTTYNYVNPVVAVSLGWLFYREHFGLREVAAMLFVFAGVAVVKYFSAAGQRVRPPVVRSHLDRVRQNDAEESLAQGPASVPGGVARLRD